MRLAKFRRFKTLLQCARPAQFRDGGATDRTPTALPVASDPFTFDERGQICDLIDRPLLPTHAESTRTGEIFEIRESVGPCGLVCTMSRRPKGHQARAQNFARRAVAAVTSDDSEECDVPSESVEPSWLESYLARLDGMRAKEMERNAHLLQQHVHWRQPGGFANRVFDRDDDGNPVEVVRDSLTCMWVPCPAQWSEQAKAEGIADVVSDRRRPALGRMARMQNENDQFMRHAVQPRLVLVTEALRALRPLTTTSTGVGPIEAAVQRLVDRSAAVVIALNHHPDRITRIGAWEDIVHARGLQTTGPLGEASATPIFRLPLALLQKIGESLKKLRRDRRGGTGCI